MCGIAAGFLRSGDAQEVVERMTCAQRHRGPDGHGFGAIELPGWRAALGHRRLAVIDLTSDAAQPMADAATGVVLTYNGEIYNFKELRRELEAAGVVFRSRSDTEVLLRAYLAWGAEAVQRLEGIFAFALWDPRSERLLLARDRFGIKPLYYYATPDVLLVASEVRALLASGVVPRRLSPSAVAGYLYTGSVVSPQTLVEGVVSLAPGHYAHWKDGRLDIREYWSLAAVLREEPRPLPADGLRDVLVSAIEAETVSDVPIGVFLSGGVDSGALVSALASVGDRQVHTVSLVFEDRSLDERAFSRAVATHFGTLHQEVQISSASVAAILPRIAEIQDLPSADGLNAYLVSRAARESGLTVALSGLGGDELFGGYDSFRMAQLWKWGGPVLRAVPGPLRTVAALATAAARGRRSKLSRLVGSARSVIDLHDLFREVFPPAAIGRLLPGVPIPRLAPDPRMLGLDPVDQMTVLESTRYMLDTTLRQCDGMSMASSLEVRCPLLNHRLAEAAMHIPADRRVRLGRQKPELVNALPRRLPASAVERTKGTFTLPFDQWLRVDQRALVIDLLMSDQTARRGVLDGAVLRALAARYLAGDPENTWSRIWTLCAFEAWCRVNIDCQPSLEA